MEFRLKTDFTDRGDQVRAIKKLAGNVKKGVPSQVLLGVTGSGKTYTVARLIQESSLPALIISHNKTLTAQLYSEFKSFFPDNAVEYFVSYYDYYQPEAYIPGTDKYIEKDASINERIERLRLKAASSLMSRSDVIVVASVSAIYGIGSPEEWQKLLVELKKGEEYPRRDLCGSLADIQYDRNDVEFSPGVFRVRGPVIDIYPAYLKDEALRVILSGDRISSIKSINPLTGEKIRDYGKYYIYPASHFVVRRSRLNEAIANIKKELKERLGELEKAGKVLEVHRLKARTEYDMEMLAETGYCHGIENYSRHISFRSPGEASQCLINYFSGDFLTIIDESHVTVPQIRAMYAGDRARKQTLVEHGFRLPSALDNRPLKLNEFEKLTGKTLYVSATPGDYELKKSAPHIVQQIVRPTGLVDPPVEIRPLKGQVRDLAGEIKEASRKKQRVLATTLTKRMAEDLSSYLSGEGLSVRYLHSEIDTLERIDILKSLRKGEFDCLIGVNLLREGLDLPEVSLVAILDADKEGFLRSQTSLIQVCGRAARNLSGRIIMYADTVTGSMKRALDEMSRRRQLQEEYNRKHSIKPETVVKAIREEKEFEYEARKNTVEYIGVADAASVSDRARKKILELMEKDMKDAADMLDFELAAAIRDKIFEIKQKKSK